MIARVELMSGLAPLALALLFADCVVADKPIDFRSDIRPILSDKCFRCHGPNEDDREGGFRLDKKESAFGEADSGACPIVASSSDDSELVRRITSDDDFERMPPPESGKSLSTEQIQRLTQWIEQGAAWDEHWSFVAPRKPAVPKVNDGSWVNNEIDNFVAKRLQDEELSPSAMTDKGTLLRRLAFDLTGLPPTVDELTAFLADESADAYGQCVDRYLASPHFGEHQARFWLDAVRYADTHGLHLDNYREMWPYRDWVVQAFNRNLPFDEFVTVQLAGDLLDDPTTEQLIATGYNRCHVTTNEGGSIEEEVYIRNVVDRVVTTATVFMGLTFDCTRCHDHKYDPLTMKDFYSLSAFFNSLNGPAMDMNAKDPAPVIPILPTEQRHRLKAIDERLAKLESRVQVKITETEYAEPTGVPLNLTATEYVWVEERSPAGSKTTGPWNYVHRPEPVFSGDVSRVQAAPELVQHYFETDSDTWVVAEGDIFFTYVLLDPRDATKQVMLQLKTGTWEHRAYWGQNRIPFGKDGTPSRIRKGDLPQRNVWVRLEVAAADVQLAAGDIITGWAFTQFGGKVYWDRAGVLTKANPQANRDSLARWTAAQKFTQGAKLPPTVREAIQSQNPSPHQQQIIRDHFIGHVWLETREKFDPLLQQLDQQRQSRTEIVANAPTTLVYRELPKPKPAHILNRGNYDAPGELVSRDTPTILPPFPAGAPRDRLGLAQWLLDPEHPLTSRVTINRIWQQFFGVGLVKTSEDFGSQGEPPSHPQLLDWLAMQFMEDDWDLKRTIKRIVMSSTYRQSSAATAALLERDPENRLLARGPRFRLDAEMLRDQALALSNLLNRELGGPSVKPPQPPGLWKAVGYVGSNTDKFVADEAPEKIHRRTLYTFFKRTAPPPQMSMLDAPSREACCVRRERTNTPLQALLLLNDPQYLEAGKALAKEILTGNHESDAQRIKALWRRCTMRGPSQPQREALLQLLAEEHSRLQQNPRLASDMLRIRLPDEQANVDENQEGETKPDITWAAWTVVANVVLNADEVLNKN